MKRMQLRDDRRRMPWTQGWRHVSGLFGLLIGLGIVALAAGDAAAQVVRYQGGPLEGRRVIVERGGSRTVVVPSRPEPIELRRIRRQEEPRLLPPTLPGQPRNDPFESDPRALPYAAPTPAPQYGPAPGYEFEPGPGFGSDPRYRSYVEPRHGHHGRAALPAPPVAGPACGFAFDQVLAETDGLLVQVDGFLRAFACRVEVVPRGRKIFDDAEDLRREALEFRAELIRGEELDDLREEFDDVADEYRDLRRRVDRVAGYRVGPNIEAVRLLAIPVERISRMLRVPGY